MDSNNTITIGDYTFEDLVLEVKITDRTIRGKYPDGPGFGPDKPWIKCAEDAQEIRVLMDEIIRLRGIK